jgi:hypothetical protein
VQVGCLVFKSEEGPSDWLKCIGLYDRPFLYNLGVLVWTQKQSYFVNFADSLVEKGHFLYIELVFSSIFLLCGTVNITIL